MRRHPASTPPAQRHPGTPPVLAGSTLPSVNPHHVIVERVTAPACVRATRGDRTVSAHGTRPVPARRGPPPRLDRVARPGPSRLVGRPRVAGRRAVARGLFSPAHRKPWAGLRFNTVWCLLIVFPIVLNGRK
jgi:hypothetical protein